MDRIDANLLELAARLARNLTPKLASQVGLSVTPVVERLKKLRARGDIRAHVALVDPCSLGLQLCAFVAVW